VINHRDAPVTVPVAGLDLVSGEQTIGATTVPAGGVRVIHVGRSDHGR